MINSSTSKRVVFRLRYPLLIFLLIFRPLLADDPPIGEFNIPLDGSTVSGTITCSGWALDDIQVESLTLYLSTGSTYTYLAEAMFIEGSRPDIATEYPSYPNNTSAGWGYSFFTNVLSDGTYYIKAVAKDNNNNSHELGVKTITIDNASSTKPFGTLDLPAVGDIISGSNYIIGGWVLTPQPNSIPTDGSTITLYIDVTPIGHPIYNFYREDIASIFSGYENSDGAGLRYYLDTTPYTDGLHSIYFTATDDDGNTEGLGSRYFYIDNGGLPVELVSFTALIKDNSVELNWQTATEVNNYGFNVECTIDNVQWETIGFINGNGTTSSPKSYSFTDDLNHNLPDPQAGLTRIDYRLKQIDNDGTFSYSKIVTVDLSSITSVDNKLDYKFSLEQNFPNPFNPTTTIKFTIPSDKRFETQDVRLMVYNSLGQRVAILINEQKSPGSYQLNFDASNLSSGVYFYMLTAGSFSQTKRLMLLR